MRCNATTTCVTCMFLQQKDEQLVGANAMLLSVALITPFGSEISHKPKDKNRHPSMWKANASRHLHGIRPASRTGRTRRITRPQTSTSKGSGSQKWRGHHNARKLHLPVLMEPQRGRTRCPSTGSVTDNFKTLTRRATSKQATISHRHAVL